MPETFANRAEAGRTLAEALAGYAEADAVVLALPRGGVPVAAEIARALGAPLDLIMVRKIGAPGQPELAAGAVTDGEHPHTVVNEHVARILGLGDDFFAAAAERELVEIARRRKRYFGHLVREPVRGRTAILVDDGIATGSTMLAAIEAVRRDGAAAVVVAVPVVPPEVVANIRDACDDFVYLMTPDWFGGVGAHYRDFHQLSDDEVIRLLDAAREA